MAKKTSGNKKKKKMCGRCAECTTRCTGSGIVLQPRTSVPDKKKP